MKKAVIFFLAILYVAITSGVMVNVHYCMGRIASVNYGTESDGHCEKCGMPQKKECCHTEHKLIKAAQAEVTAVSHFECSAPMALLPSHHYALQAVFKAGSAHADRRYHSPPDPGMNSLRLYQCVFRI